MAQPQVTLRGAAKTTLEAAMVRARETAAARVRLFDDLSASARRHGGRRLGAGGQLAAAIFEWIGPGAARPGRASLGDPSPDACETRHTTAEAAA